MRALLSVLPAALLVGCAATGGKMGEFSSNTVDVGIVVSDANKAVAFYRDALGFTELPGFDVPASMGADSGLSDAKPFHVHVMKLADAKNATSVKLMEFPGTPGARPNNEFIHSTLGLRYLTVYVTDMTGAVARAKKAGAMPIAKGPVALPPAIAKGVYLAVLRDPDGNMIELVGPKK